MKKKIVSASNPMLLAIIKNEVQGQIAFICDSLHSSPINLHPKPDFYLKNSPIEREKKQYVEITFVL